MSGAAITDIIPHRPPMLLLDAVIEQTADQIRCRKTFRADEPCCTGYTPASPTVPAMFLCEAALQAGALLLAQEPHAENQVPVVTRLNQVAFGRSVRPGETVELSAVITERLAGAYFLRGVVTCQEQAAVTLEFSVALAPRAEGNA